MGSNRQRPSGVGFVRADRNQETGNQSRNISLELQDKAMVH